MFDSTDNVRPSQSSPSRSWIRRAASRSDQQVWQLWLQLLRDVGDIWRYMEIWDAAGSLGVVGVGCVSCRPGTAMSISAPQLHCGGWWYLYPAWVAICEHQYLFIFVHICFQCFLHQSISISFSQTELWQSCAWGAGWYGGRTLIARVLEHLGLHTAVTLFAALTSDSCFSDSSSVASRYSVSEYI